MDRLIEEKRGELLPLWPAEQRTQSKFVHSAMERGYDA